MAYAPFPLIELSGSPIERGRQHGRAAPDQIKRGIRMYAESLLTSGVEWQELERRAEAMVPAIEAFDARYVEEMRGIAEGSGQPFAGIMLMNARTEMVSAARRQQAAKHFPDGCTAAFALPEATAAGVLLHGQNWDWRAECAETSVVLRIRRDDGPDILTFTEAGGLARSGLNSAGIGLTANALECDRDYQRGAGVPLPFIRRKVLEAEYLALSVRTIFATPKLGSNHMAVSHCGGEAFGFECAPDETSGSRPSAASTSTPTTGSPKRPAPRSRTPACRRRPTRSIATSGYAIPWRPGMASSRSRISARPSSTIMPRRTRSAARRVPTTAAPWSPPRRWC